uniref:Uncharacterized protein n=1 Tax=Rhizophora mucronata TaxID=61149 RepID=A0A2P2PV39_RHIMU
MNMYCHLVCQEIFKAHQQPISFIIQISVHMSVSKKINILLTFLHPV